MERDSACFSWLRAADSLESTVRAGTARSKHTPRMRAAARIWGRRPKPLDRGTCPTDIPDALPRRGRTAQPERMPNCWRRERAVGSLAGAAQSGHIQPSSHTPAASYGIGTAQSEHMSNRCRYVERTVRVPLSTPRVTVQADCATSAWPDRGRRRSQADYRDRRRCEPPVRRSRREHGAVC